ncbi:hypothetical protein E4U55_007073 [Claviceps digitariae]|nr:hypothetical protein E4U55_007073 [Claviceps digitariae]
MVPGTLPRLCHHLHVWVDVSIDPCASGMDAIAFVMDAGWMLDGASSDDQQAGSSARWLDGSSAQIWRSTQIGHNTSSLEHRLDPAFLAGFKGSQGVNSRRPNVWPLIPNFTDFRRFPFIAAGIPIKFRQRPIQPTINQQHV